MISFVSLDSWIRNVEVNWNN